MPLTHLFTFSAPILAGSLLAYGSCMVLEGARSQQKDTTANVFLPSEGDSGIPGKAFGLCDGDQITDATITRPINSR